MVQATHPASVTPHNSADANTELILDFAQVGIQDVPRVGGKNASLGEMIQQLAPQGVRVPNGFATTAYAYRDFIREAGLETQMRSHFKSLDIEDLEALRQCGRRVRDLILETPFPPRPRICHHAGIPQTL